MKSTQPRWVHLDAKGMMPSMGRLPAWLDLLAAAGFNGVVWEYEDRLPWQTWPGTHRPGYSLEEWQQIWQWCADRNLEVIPLIQSLGHLEWLLKHEAYADLRENGSWTEWCPSHPRVLPLFEQWLEEVIRIHPALSAIHLGGDETWHLATCPACREVSARHPDGDMGVYVEHMIRVCQAAVRRGLRPMIWADMFTHEEKISLVERLPQETILVDWCYQGSGPWESVSQLARTGREVFGASGVRINHNTQLAQAPLAGRLQNIEGWQCHGPEPAGIIHTFWARSRSLLPVYGPWEGWLPALLAAGNPDHPGLRVLRPWIDRLDAALGSMDYRDSRKLFAELELQEWSGEWENECRLWWILALRHHDLYLRSLSVSLSYRQLASVSSAVGVTPDWVNFSRLGLRQTAVELHEWAVDAESFLSDREWSDREEWIATRRDPLLALLEKQPDWATHIPPAEPLPRRKRKTGGG